MDLGVSVAGPSKRQQGSCPRVFSDAEIGPQAVTVWTVLPLAIPTSDQGEPFIWKTTCS